MLRLTKLDSFEIVVLGYLKGLEETEKAEQREDSASKCCSFEDLLQEIFCVVTVLNNVFTKRS